MNGRHPKAQNSSPRHSSPPILQMKVDCTSMMIKPTACKAWSRLTTDESNLNVRNDNPLNTLANVAITELKTSSLTPTLKVYHPPSNTYWNIKKPAAEHKLFHHSCLIREMYKLPQQRGYLKRFHFTCKKRRLDIDKRCTICKERSRTHTKCLNSKDIWIWQACADADFD